jgi:hypothetical protein
MWEHLVTDFAWNPRASRDNTLLKGFVRNRVISVISAVLILKTSAKVFAASFLNCRILPNCSSLIVFSFGVNVLRSTRIRPVIGIAKHCGLYILTATVPGFAQRFYHLGHICDRCSTVEHCLSLRHPWQLYITTCTGLLHEIATSGSFLLPVKEGSVQNWRA